VRRRSGGAGRVRGADEPIPGLAGPMTRHQETAMATIHRWRTQLTLRPHRNRPFVSPHHCSPVFCAVAG
jgi:hypothetical protein